MLPSQLLSDFPLWVDTLWGKEGSSEVTAFGSMMDRWPGEPGWAQRNPLDHCYEIRALGGTDKYGGPIWAVLVMILGSGEFDLGSGRPILRYIYRSELPKPLARYPLASKHVQKAEAPANSSKEIEQPWARAARGTGAQKSCGLIDGFRYFCVIEKKPSILQKMYFFQVFLRAP